MNIKRCISFLAIVFLTIVTLAPAVSAALSSRTLANDLTYYRRISREKNLDTNGRYYILMRIVDKYRNAKVNLAPLKAELRHLKLPGTDDPTPVSDAAPDAPTALLNGTVEKLLISETAQDSRVTVVVQSVNRYNYFLLRDPEPNKQPKIVLDLYGAENRLAARAKNVLLRNGLFSRIQTSQFEDKPNPIVRIVAHLRQDAPYRIVREGERLIIIAEKNASPSPAATPAPAATMSGPAGVIDDVGTGAVIPAAVQSPEITSFPRNDAPPVPARTSSLPNATSTSYRIETGDILGITVFPADELSRESVVQYDGTVIFPLVGAAKASGLSPKQLEESLQKGLSRYLSNPQVTVAIKQFSRRQVFVTGEARSVGAYNYRDNMRLMEFISSLGGFTDNANRREVKVYRGTGDKRKIFTNDLEDIIRSGDFSKDFVLEPGDIVEVPQGRARVAVLGDVRNPGYYDYRDNLYLLELVSLAGGFTDTAAISRVSILRDNGGSKESKKVSIVNLKGILDGKSADVPVSGGDTVYIPKKNLASASWFVSNILPWLSLASLVLLIRGGV